MDTQLRLLIAVTLIGAAAFIGQVAVFREVFVLAQGHELSLVLVLGCFLIGGGVGSLFGGWLGRRFPTRGAELTIPSLGLAILVVLTLLLLQRLPILLNMLPFEQISLAPLLFWSLAIISPLAVAGGIVYSVAVRALDAASARTARRLTPSWVYAAEAAGAGVAGLALYFFLLSRLLPTQVALVASATLLIASCLATTHATNRRPIAQVTLLSVCLISLFWPGLHTRLQSMSWRGVEVTAFQGSPQGLLTAARSSEVVSLFENGLLLTTEGFQGSATRIAGLVRLTHPNPERVLLVGRPLRGVSEALRSEGIGSVDVFHGNSETIHFARKHLSRPVLQSEDVRWHPVDNRRSISESTLGYDVAIVDVGAPWSLSTSRFGTKEFYRTLLGVLADEGLLLVAVPGPPQPAIAQHSAWLATIRVTLASTFDEILALPGDDVIFIAGSAGALARARAALASTGSDAWAGRLLGRQSGLSHDSLALLLDAHSRRSTSASSDDRPIHYLRYQTYRLLRDSGVLVSIVERMEDVGRNSAFGVVLLLAFVGVVSALRGRAGIGIAASAGVIGFSSMSLHMLVMFQHQLHEGDLYTAVAALTGSFMVGMTSGGAAISKLLQLPIRPRMLLGGVLLAFALTSWGMVHLFHHGFSGTAGLSILTGFTGLLTGMGFGAATGAGRDETTKWVHSPAALYALDLAGGGFATILTGFLLVPILGVNATGNLLAFAIVAVLGVLLVESARIRV